MAATAYAALVSIMNTIDQFQNHPLLYSPSDNYQFEVLHERVDFFLHFVENSSDADSVEVEALVRRIAVVVQEAEDIIDVEAAHLIRGGITRKSQAWFLNLQRILEDMDSIKVKVAEIGLFKNSMPPPSSSSAAAAAPVGTSKVTMVGFEGYLNKLLHELTKDYSGRLILPIVGMGGIGKTTLARNAYENLLTIYHFDVLVWVTVSQDHNATGILVQALSCLVGFKSKNDKTDDDDDGELGKALHKSLYGIRYLIVLDDVWSVEAWENIKVFFPKNNTGSRIIVTTRQQQVADYFGSFALALDFLDHKTSWDLFCKRSFDQDDCPTELEGVGKKIVEKCKGLPLAITVIGGLLGKSPRTQEYWMKILQDNSLVLEYAGDDGKIPLGILSLSYKHLPVCLKPCFLYLGLFPEDHQIDVSQLIKLWVAEGFINKGNTSQSLEEIAESYIKALVGRNLLLVGDHLTGYKKFTTCCLHDLVREMCIKIAEKEKFHCLQRDIAGWRQFIVDRRTASLYPSQSLTTSRRPSILTPLIFNGQREAPLQSRLLRTLVDDRGCLDPTFQQVNLRFLLHKPSLLEKASYTCKLPSSISLCWSLQTLIFHETTSIVVPPEIWNMPQLRHIEMMPMLYLPDPPENNDLGLQNLQTLKKVQNFNFTKEACKRIANIKELDVEYSFNEHRGASWCFALDNIGCLNKLESLNYSGSGKEYVRDPLQKLKLPNSLKELVLWGCHLVWSDMEMIASLPRLEILELHNKAVIGKEWNFVDVEFICLKHLHIHFCDNLVNWIAESSNFPVLETLTLLLLTQLEEIPWGMGEIPTLERVYLHGCSDSSTISAMKILEEQESLGNDHLQVQLHLSNKSDADMWKVRIQELGFKCQNLLIIDVPF